MGVRSNTNVYLVYMEGIAYPELVAKIEERLEGFEIDGVLDSGVIEQLSEEKMVFPVSTVSDDGTAGPGGNVHP